MRLVVLVMALGPGGVPARAEEDEEADSGGSMEASAEAQEEETEEGRSLSWNERSNY